MIQVHQTVETPKGIGTVLGQNDRHEIVVRLKVQQKVPDSQKAATFSGWIFDFPETDLKPVGK